jgi:hypothetical protein
MGVYVCIHVPAIEALACNPGVLMRNCAIPLEFWLLHTRCSSVSSV